MASKTKRNRQKQVRNLKKEKKPLIDPKYKNTFWTVVILIVLAVFFIINNTRNEVKEGPYPPGYHPAVPASRWSAGILLCFLLSLLRHYALVIKNQRIRKPIIV